MVSVIIHMYKLTTRLISQLCGLWSTIKMRLKVKGRMDRSDTTSHHSVSTTKCLKMKQNSGQCPLLLKKTMRFDLRQVPKEGRRHVRDQFTSIYL